MTLSINRKVKNLPLTVGGGHRGTGPPSTTRLLLSRNALLYVSENNSIYFNCERFLFVYIVIQKQTNFEDLMKKFRGFSKFNANRILLEAKF